jgi:uncharacterized protein with ParB-like and HNH nuclease domain
METIQELRSKLQIKPQQINSSISFFAKHCEIDFDVFLPTKNRNLQRDFVWDIDQKRELIWSILIGRNIPRMAMINTYEEVYQVIDGKQRLSTMLEFYKGKFSLKIDGKYYLYLDLPQDYQRQIERFNFSYYIVNEIDTEIISDEQKIHWFKFINFAGTPQELSHLNSL